MALNGAELLSTLTDILAGVIASPSASAAGTNWATAYDTYAKTGRANGVIPTVPAATVTALASALGTAFSSISGVPATVASGIRTALDVYWSGVMFAGQVAPPAPGGSAALTTVLAGIFSVVGGTYASKATEIRDALAAYTTAVIVTFPGPATFPIV